MSKWVFAGAGGGGGSPNSRLYVEVPEARFSRGSSDTHPALPHSREEGDSSSSRIADRECEAKHHPATFRVECTILDPELRSPSDLAAYFAALQVSYVLGTLRGLRALLRLAWHHISTLPAALTESGSSPCSGRHQASNQPLPSDPPSIFANKAGEEGRVHGARESMR